jgi:hypothetical protein
MKIGLFKISRAMLLIILMVIGTTATATANETIRSWWETTKQATKNVWNNSTHWVKTWVNSVNEVEADYSVAAIWKKILPTFDQLLALEKQQETLPDSAWFSQDKTDNNVEINQLLDEAVAILSFAASNATRQQIRTLEQQIRELKQTIFQYRQAQISAPQQSTWETTAQGYEDKIKQNLALIEQADQKIAQLQTDFAQQLAEHHLYLNSAQLDVLLSSVVGDDIIQMSIVYDNIKKITQQLMTLALDSGEDLEISQRYYGMYMVLLKILLHMQQNFITQIEEKYQPKLAQIMEKVQNIQYTTENLLRHETDINHRHHLAANLEAQQLTLTTAQLYQQHLQQQRSKLVQAKAKTVSDWQIAQNTYKTVIISGELVSLLRSSQKFLDLLLNLQVPELVEFENLQMKQEFAILTQQLAE